jgi:hypothetical protein
MFCCPWRFYCPGITWLRLAAWEVADVIDAAGGTQLGLPAPEVIEELYELRDGHTATMLYLWGLPIVAMAQLQRAHREVLGGGDFDLGAYLSYDDKLGILTPNTVTPYYMAFADLGRTGPLVIDVPAGPIAGGASDFWQQPIVDMGQTGRDRGTGGRYLLVGPDQDAPVAGGCYLGRSRTNNVWVALRLLTTDAAECERILAAFQLYPFADREDAPRTRIVYPDGTRWNQAQPSGLSYFEALAEILGREPVAERDQFFHGIARSLGPANAARPSRPVTASGGSSPPPPSRARRSPRPMPFTSASPARVTGPAAAGTSWSISNRIRPAMGSASSSNGPPGSMRHPAWARGWPIPRPASGRPTWAPTPTPRAVARRRA